jgi:hypothetical protein
MCGCILALLAMGMPRLVLAVIWATTDWFGQAFQGVLVPLVGWVFMPYTTAVYLAAMLRNDHQVTTGWLVLLILAVVIDVGAYRTGGQVVVRGVVIRPLPPRPPEG